MCFFGRNKVKTAMPERYIFSLRESSRIRSIGKKAENLRFLADDGFPTPVTYACTWDAYVRYAQGDVLIILRSRSMGTMVGLPYTSWHDVRAGGQFTGRQSPAWRQGRRSR